MRQKLNLLIVLIIPIVFFLISLLTLSHYGINWDEPYHYRRGQAFLQFFLTGRKNYANLSKYPSLKGESDNPDFRDAQKHFEEVQKNPTLSDPNSKRSFYQDDSWNGEFFIDMEHSYGHPALNGVFASLFNKIFYQELQFLGDLESYRLFIILTVFIATLAIALFMWKEYGVIESVISSLSFSTCPLMLGEQHFNIKDPIEASFYALTVITTYLGIKKNKIIWLFWGSIFFGLALSTKFNIVFSIIPLGLWFIYHLKQEVSPKDRIKLVKKIAVILPTALFIMLGLLLISYPTTWKDPINSLGQIVNFYLKSGYPSSGTTGSKLFGLLNTYPLLWITYTTAPIVLFLSFVTVIFSKKLIQKNSFVLLLLLWFIVAVGRNSLFGALSYGGVRLIMEYIPAVSMLSGIGAGLIVYAYKSRKYLILSTIVLFFAFIPTIAKLINIHPNENVYFNILVGGLNGAKEKNIPSWGNSYGNAYYSGVLWLNQNAQKNSKVSTPIGNTSNIPRFKLREDLAVSPNYWSGLKYDGEYLIELTYDYPPKDWFALKYLNEIMIPVHEVTVDGVAIAKVWKNDYSKVKAEYKNTKIIDIKPIVDINAKTIQIELPGIEKIMEIKLTQPTVNCQPTQTGYVTTSIDSINWIREPEDIAQDQLQRHKIKSLSPEFNFYFVARDAKILTIYIDNSDSCLLKAANASITVLSKN